MTIFALALASNLKPQQHLSQAIQALANVGECTQSKIYQIPCRDGIGADYFNLAIMMDCQHDFEYVRQFIHQLEINAQRIRPSHQISLDIDIIAWGDDLAHMQFNTKKIPLPIDVRLPMSDIWQSTHPLLSVESHHSYQIVNL